VVEGRAAVAFVGLSGREFEGFGDDILVGDHSEEVVDAVEPGAFFAVGVHDEPWGFGDVGMGEHFILGAGILDPPLSGFEVHGAELPLFGGVLEAALEAAFLLVVADGKPVFDEDDAGADEHAFELGAGAEEFAVFPVGAEAHDAFDACAVVPGAVEEDHFAGGGELGDVSLKVPLGFFAFGGGSQGDNAGDAGIEGLGDPLDDAPLSGGVSAFEEDDDFQALVLDPLLELDQLDLEAGKLFFVGFLIQLFGGRRGVFAGRGGGCPGFGGRAFWFGHDRSFEKKGCRRMDGNDFRIRM